MWELIPRLGGPLEEEMAPLLRHSLHLGNEMDKGAWWAAAGGAARVGHEAQGG